MEILMSGEIYLKRGPRIIPNNDISNRNEERFDLLEEDFKTDPNISPESLKRFREFRELISGSNTVERKDYSGCSSFWVSIVDDDGIRMVENLSPIGDVKTFDTKNEIDKEFIRLRVFLDQANYVGRYFKRTKPFANGSYVDRSFMHDTNSLVLYATDSILIIQRETPYFKNQKIEIISSRYLEDNNYEFIGKINEEFKDKPKLYQLVFKQLTDKKDKTL